MELLTATLKTKKSSKKNTIPVMGIELSEDSVNEFSGESANVQYCRTAERAYYKSEARGFEPGHEWDDWLAAEEEVLAGEAL
jgi:hypothetical protein